MSDDKITPDPDELGKQIAELTKKLEDFEKVKEDLATERDEYKAKFEDSKTSRDKAKEKEREEAKKRGEFETVVKDLEDKIKALETQTAEIEALKKTKESYDALQEKIRTDLIARLPEADREKFKDFSIVQIETVLSVIPDGKNIPVDGMKRTPPVGGTKPWDEMTAQERETFASAHGAAEVAKKIQESKIRR